MILIVVNDKMLLVENLQQFKSVRFFRIFDGLLWFLSFSTLCFLFRGDFSSRHRPGCPCHSFQARVLILLRKNRFMRSNIRCEIVIL